MMIVDAHLDLSHNALKGRNVLAPAREQIDDGDGIPTVGLPDLKAGGVGLICATIYISPSIDGKPGYRHGGGSSHRGAAAFAVVSAANPSREDAVYYERAGDARSEFFIAECDFAFGRS